MRARRISDVEFCKNCLRFIDEVCRTRRSIVITRDGVPIARIVPVRLKSTRKKSLPVAADGDAKRRKAGPSTARPPDSQKKRIGKGKRTLRSG